MSVCKSKMQFAEKQLRSRRDRKRKKGVLARVGGNKYFEGQAWSILHWSRTNSRLRLESNKLGKRKDVRIEAAFLVLEGKGTISADLEQDVVGCWSFVWTLSWSWTCF